MQGRDDSREGSASSVPYPEPETLPRGRASVSTPLQSATESPSLEIAPPPTATPASELGSSSIVLSSGAGPAQGGTDSADDVFSTAEEVFSAPDSPHKEFHCAVVRALSKEPSVVEAAKAEQAPGTSDDAESCLKSGLPLPSSPAQPWSVSHTAALGVWISLPGVSSPFSWGLESAAIVLPSILPTHSSIFEAFA